MSLDEAAGLVNEVGPDPGGPRLPIEESMFIVRTRLPYRSIRGVGVFLEQPRPSGQVVWHDDPPRDRALPAEELKNDPPMLQDYLKTYMCSAA